MRHTPSPTKQRALEHQFHPHRPFALVLAGGGARGLAHVGVLRALEHEGYYPAAIVGVSMGAIVAGTYSLNPDWYRELLAFDTRELPQQHARPGSSWRGRLLHLADSTRTLRSMLLGWGIGQYRPDATWNALEHLTRGRRLDEGRVPVTAVATDLRSGDRVAIRTGSAARAAYASSALAGIQPPLEHEGALLADGGYSDLAPVDLARSAAVDVVIVVDPGQPGIVAEPRNGLQAMLRAAEICHYQHAHLRFAQADLVLQPRFPHAIGTLDFSHTRLAVASGVRAVRTARAPLARLLRPAPAEPAARGAVSPAPPAERSPS